MLAIHNPRILFLSGTLLLTMLAPPLFAHAEDAPPEMRTDFTLSRRIGHCGNCRVAVGLVDIHFASDRAVWAQGGAPPGETGFGDYVALHSRDGGATWTELGWTYSHNSPIAFDIAEDGRAWIANDNVVEDKTRLMTLRSGAHRWHEVDQSQRLSLLRDLALFPDGHGYAVEAAAAPDSDTILRTTNGGRTWHKPGVDGAPHLIDRIFFLGRTLGWIAGASPA